MPPAEAPLILLAFNRPAYFERFLASLLAQEGLSRHRRDVFLFLDGARNRHSGAVYAQEQDIARCEALFRAHLPQGTVFRARSNLGIFGNFERAERFAFEALGAETAYFFEDDLVLSPFYLQAMDQLRQEVEARDDIAYFSAYGNHWIRRPEQQASLRAVMELHHHWAFGLTRRHWRRIAAALEPAATLLRQCDYRQRPGPALRQWLRSLGMLHVGGTSQDYLKSMVASHLGFWRLSSVACWGSYIGESGLHFTPDLFRQQGFHLTELYDRPPEGFDLPDEPAVRALVAQRHATYRGDSTAAAE